MTIIELNSWEKRRVEDRCFYHWRNDVLTLNPTSNWRTYWKVNAKQCFKNARMFKGLLRATGWNRYLSEYDLNPWTIYNVETMNG